MPPLEARYRVDTERELTRDESLAAIKGLSHNEARTLIKQRDLRLDKDVLKILYALEYLASQGDISVMDAFYLGMTEGVRLLDPDFTFIPVESEYKYTNKSKQHATSATNETSPTSSILTSEPSSPSTEVASQLQREKVLREFVHMLKPTRFLSLDDDIITDNPWADYVPGRIIAKFGKMELIPDWYERKISRDTSVWTRRNVRKKDLKKQGRFLVDFATFTNDIDCNKPSQDEDVFYDTSDLKCRHDSESEDDEEGSEVNTDDDDDANDDLIESEEPGEEEEEEIVNSDEEIAVSFSVIQQPITYPYLTLAPGFSPVEEEEEDEEEFSSPVSIPKPIIKKSSPAFEHLPFRPRKLFSDILNKNSFLKARTSSNSINQILNDSSDVEGSENRKVEGGSSKGNTILEQMRAKKELKRKRQREWEEEVEMLTDESEGEFLSKREPTAQKKKNQDLKKKKMKMV